MIYQKKEKYADRLKSAMIQSQTPCEVMRIQFKKWILRKRLSSETLKIILTNTSYLKFLPIWLKLMAEREAETQSQVFMKTTKEISLHSYFKSKNCYGAPRWLSR